ncbi:MAG: S8 family serine peptidase [Clostridia bacterium]|nr:S8 family serine peptidase [Clostridia bacterium]
MKTSLIVNEVSENSSIGYSPQQIKKAYNISNYGNGNGVSVAVIDFIGNRYLQNNLNIFSREFGLPETELKFYGDINNGDNFNFSAYIEPSVDTQWIHGISPYSEIRIIRATNFTVPGVIDAVKTAIELNTDIILQTFQAPFEEEYLKYSDIYNNNTVFIASAGDYGAGAFFPSCFPQCISVGGTSLDIDNNGNRNGVESAWTESGGGICRYIDIPDYQLKFSPINTLTMGKRGVPDVSFLADPDTGYAVYHSSIEDSFGWYSAGGTSIAAAVIAGIIANLISYTALSDKSNMIRYLYNMAGETSYTNPYNVFNDITTGGNGEFSARPGYDLCTGLGSLINI